MLSYSSRFQLRDLKVLYRDVPVSEFYLGTDVSQRFGCLTKHKQYDFVNMLTKMYGALCSQMNKLKSMLLNQPITTLAS